MEKQYRVSQSFIFFNYFVYSIFIIVGVISLFNAIFVPTFEPKWFVVLWAMLVFLGGYFLYGLPYLILLTEKNTLIFKSRLNDREFLIQDTISIKTDALRHYFIHFKFNSGRISMFNELDDLNGLIEEIGLSNSNVVIKVKERKY